MGLRTNTKLNQTPDYHFFFFFSLERKQSSHKLRSDILSGYFGCPCLAAASGPDLTCQERKVALDPVIHSHRQMSALTLLVWEPHGPSSVVTWLG